MSTHSELFDLVVPTLVATVALYLIYILLLRKENNFVINRIYLIGSLLFAFAIPFVNFTIIVPKTTEIEMLPMETTIYPMLSGQMPMKESSSIFDFFVSAEFWKIIAMIYLAGVVVFFGFFVYKLVRILHLIIAAPKERHEDYILVRTNKNLSPVSFFKYIIINDKSYSNAEIEQIILHERKHILQWHSLDLMLMELAVVFQWFNPIIRLYCNELRSVHEYIADKSVLHSGISEIDYLQLLFRQATGMQTISIGNNFSQCLTLKRIKMMKKNKISKWATAKLLFAVPVMAALVAVFCITTSCEDLKNSDEALNDEMSIPQLNYDSYEDIIVEGEMRSVKWFKDEDDPCWSYHITKEGDTIGTSFIQQKTDTYPEFPGGETGKQNFYSEQLGYRIKFLETDDFSAKNSVRIIYHISPEGKAEFRACSNDDVTNVSNIIINDLRNAVNAMPTWKPATHKGKNVTQSVLDIIEIPNEIANQRDSIYIIVEKQPEYPGGEAARMQFLMENLKYPQQAKADGIQGTVYLRFVVEKDGTVSNVELLRGIGGGCDEEAMRVIKMMPKWKPGKKDGKAVAVQYNLPIKFTLSNVSASKKEVSQKSDSVYIIVEKQPEYPGGDAARMQFLKENMKYPQQAKADGIQGTVYVTFVVEKDGAVSHVKILRGIGGGCDEEAMRVIKMMPKWKPGKKDGKAVAVQFNLPIRFTLPKTE